MLLVSQFHCVYTGTIIVLVVLTRSASSVDVEYMFSITGHEKLTPESGVEFMAPISGAGFWSVCTRLKKGEFASLSFHELL